MITITTSGGFSGMGQPAREKSVETETLEDSRRDEVCRRFDPDALKKLEKRKAGAESADRFTYHITVTDDSGEKRRFEIPEAALPAEMLDMIDEF